MRREITVLEDDQDIREICNYLFTSEGYSVNTFATVSSFNESNTQPDLYLLDIRLPDGNGIEVCKLLKDDPITSKIPILMMSAHLDANTVRSQCSADAFIAKPFHLQDLIARVYQLISKP